MNGQAQIAAVFLAGFFAAADPVPSDTPVATSAHSKPKVVYISAGSCAYMARHRPTSDVRYQPGVAADGRKVRPADLEPRLTFANAPVYEFEVKYAPLPAAQTKLDETSLSVAKVAYEPSTGRITVNDQDLVWLHEKEIARACEEQQGEAEAREH